LGGGAVIVDEQFFITIFYRDAINPSILQGIKDCKVSLMVIRAMPR